jgi:hypothetical protein
VPSKKAKQSKSVRRAPDIDAQNARELARELCAVADGLEEGRCKEWRPVIRVLLKTYWDLDDPRPSVADAKHRKWLIGLLELNGKLVRGGQAVPDATDMCLRVMHRNLPEYDARLTAQRRTIEAVLQTYRTNVGGRGRRTSAQQSRPALVEHLCESIGWSGGTGAIRQARARQKKKQVTG